MNSWSAKKALAVCDTQWGRWSDSLHGISFFKKRCMVKSDSKFMGAEPINIKNEAAKPYFIQILAFGKL